MTILMKLDELKKLEHLLTEFSGEPDLTPRQDTQVQGVLMVVADYLQQLKTEVPREYRSALGM